MSNLKNTSSNKHVFIQEVICIPFLQSDADFICLFVNRNLFIAQQKAQVPTGYVLLMTNKFRLYFFMIL
ncbi:protein of unknown function [Xenorhabdus doucetiae]|uniref:Uncharacterized protein n=1 Tax=Xenorhabdus doucetiae TaxID=351671 RepID=A0A068QNH3_9GAMM|nr:protein of unknown function [Xenorhabdus doucetiae]